jgi:hypothetical protein
VTRKRVADYLAAADLARLEVDRERQRGANEAARAKSIAGLANSVPGIATSIFDASMKQDAKAKADEATKIERERTERADKIRDAQETRAATKFDTEQAAGAEQRAREQAEFDAKQRADSDAKAKAAREEVLKNRIAKAVAAGEDPREVASELRDLEETHDVGTSEVVRRYNEMRDAREATKRKEFNDERDFQLKEADQKDRSARGWASIAAQKEAARARAEQKNRPKPDEAGDVRKLDVALSTARKILADKGEIDTGPIANVRNLFASKVGLDDADVSEFRALVGDQLAAYIKDISGAAASDKERAFLEKNTPTIGDNDETFLRKVNNVIWKVEQMRAGKVQALDDAGRETSMFAREDDLDSPDSFFGGG